MLWLDLGSGFLRPPCLVGGLHCSGKPRPVTSEQHGDWEFLDYLCNGRPLTREAPDVNLCRRDGLHIALNTRDRYCPRWFCCFGEDIGSDQEHLPNARITESGIKPPNPEYYKRKEPMRGSGGYWMAILLFGSVLAAEARPSSDTLTPPDYRPLVRFRHKQDGIPESFQIKGLYGPNSFENACKHKYCGLGKHCVMDHVSGQGECQCLDRCKPHYKPVCGSNGKFYQNHCELHRASCLAHQRITIVHSEECFYKGNGVLIDMKRALMKGRHILSLHLDHKVFVQLLMEHLLVFYVEGAPLGAEQASQDGPGGSHRSATGRGCPRSPPMGVPWGRTPPSPPDTADGTRLAWSSGGPTLGTPETPQCQGVAVAPHQS
ncbi:hypothetical protein QTP70_002231 [Hemibagrus guttatus]|uniref:Kazal-like domain-containing protein n=1 Tax=Hemibagrus guttatus TaxID=175788 RepID=A0AAE0V4V3_9TELE|nr:hypothetical protein QTP70_002231 [Hemibagrus guttatus]